MQRKSAILISVIGVFFILASNVNAQIDSSNVAVPNGTSEAVVKDEANVGVIQREENKTISSQTRDSTQENKDRIDKQHEEFKQKLQVIKDERKKAIVQRIDERIVDMNANHASRFSEVLENLNMVLNKISVKKETLTNEAIDVSLLEISIATAKGAIDGARTAVDIQSKKTYVIEITTEAALKTTVGKTISEFRTDLKNVHKQVVDARQAVHNAERELLNHKAQNTTKIETTVRGGE